MDPDDGPGVPGGHPMVGRSQIPGIVCMMGGNVFSCVGLNFQKYAVMWGERNGVPVGRNWRWMLALLVFSVGQTIEAYSQSRAGQALLTSVATIRLAQTVFHVLPEQQCDDYTR